VFIEPTYKYKGRLIYLSIFKNKHKLLLYFLLNSVNLINYKSENNYVSRYNNHFNIYIFKTAVKNNFTEQVNIA